MELTTAFTMHEKASLL